jgi:transcriptional antiterminator NusG
MTDDLTETTDMSNDDTTTDEATANPVDLLPMGDTDVLAEVAESDEIADPTSELDMAEEVEAVHIESDETQAAEEDASGESEDWNTASDDESDDAESDPATASEGSASDEADQSTDSDDQAHAADEDAAAEGSASDEAGDDADQALDEETDGEASPVVTDDPTMRPGQWYVVHTQSGYEKKVTANLEARIQSMNMEDKIYEIVIPMEEVDEFKNGKKQTVQRKVFPGYLLVRCVMDDE